jgi:L-methionine (R)-S-oxide reductase
VSVDAAASRLAREEIQSLLVPGRTAGALFSVCRSLRSRFSHYNWVGIYLLRGTSLHLVAWDGKAATEHVRIPLGEGVCGLAAREGRTVNVPDVRASREYLACFLETRSEIVVPILGEAGVLGEIDIDGDQVNPYDASDEAFLMEVARLLSPHAEVVRRGPPAPPVGPTGPGSA